MVREVLPSLNERQFFTKALAENIRLDGRAFDAYRHLTLTFGDEYGVSDVKLGNTRIITKISHTIQPPLPTHPSDGLFTITTALSPLPSPIFTPSGPPTETEMLLSRLLEKTLRRSGALDTESLCLLAGRAVFNIRTDVHILSHDGNLVDAACIGVVAALRHFKLPAVEVRGEDVVAYTFEEREGVPLSLLHSPFCVTFSFYEDEVVLVDATLMEEQLAEGKCTISLNTHGEVCQIAKLGGGAVDAVILLNSSSLAVQHVRTLGKLVDERLKDDARRRDKGGMGAELSADNPRVS